MDLTLFIRYKADSFDVFTVVEDKLSSLPESIFSDRGDLVVGEVYDLENLE